MARNNIEQVVVSKIMEDKTMIDFLDGGILVSFFVEESWHKTYQWIIDYQGKHGVIPTALALKRAYPNVDLLEDIEDPAPALVEEMIERRRKALTKRGLQDAVDAFDADDVSESIAVLTRTIATVNVETSRTMVVRSRDFIGPAVQEALTVRSTDLLGIPTGFPTIDESTGGMQREQFLLLIANPKAGKAQPYGSQVLTTSGWAAIEALSVGDEVVSPVDGLPRVITHTWDWGLMDVYRVSLDDGSSTLATAEHEWLVHPHNPPRQRVVETRDLLSKGDRFALLPLCSPVILPVAELPLDPYVLGLLIGDGGFTDGGVVFTNPEDDLVQAVRKVFSITSRGPMGWYLKGARPLAKDLGLDGKYSYEKEVPEQYLWASADQRFALLQGLLDTDGGMEQSSTKFTTSSKLLADNVVHLVRSLGGCVSVHQKIPYLNGVAHRMAYRLTIRMPESCGCPFRSVRKAASWNNGQRKRAPSRRVVAVEAVGREPVRCLTVDGGLYITDDFIVTKNSTVSLAIALAAQRAGYKGLYLTFEMSNHEVQQRYLSLGAHVNLTSILRGMVSTEKFGKERSAAERLRYFEEEVADMSDLTLVHDISSITTLGGVKAKLDQHQPDFLVVDGLYLMSDDKGEPDGSPQALTNISRGCKRLAANERIPFFGTTQALLSRTSKTKGVQMGSTGYTSAFAQDVDGMFGLDRDDLSQPTARLKVIAARNSMGVEVDLTFDYSRGLIEEAGGFAYMRSAKEHKSDDD